MTQRRDSDGRPPLPGAGLMEDYTMPFLVVAGVLCFLVLLVLWAWLGLPAVIILAAVADWMLRRKQTAHSVPHDPQP
ncbi:hypothetical protein P1J78_04250 [Psychromarinibacter sp. C21-152]|uniref:Uncharacterized protein n=1 Tax=Psychromarinibacter sediminicola TaxID=3033385 RepID=A0AAE3T8W3_9RHOB|nr:hypothetical protein [Psychromarinibacter sediminicola]MDF0599935.1 hypothetical protein [Psychromarinibacter sediminicola]